MRSLQSAKDLAQSSAVWTGCTHVVWSDPVSGILCVAPQEKMPDGIVPIHLSHADGDQIDNTFGGRIQF